MILNNLIHRGLKRVLTIVSDNFSGLKAPISVLFSKSIYQLCFIHMQRNVHRNMAKENTKKFNLKIYNKFNTSNKIS